jgi:hypothetical protein
MTGPAANDFARRQEHQGGNAQSQNKETENVQYAFHCEPPYKNPIKGGSFYLDYSLSFRF